MYDDFKAALAQAGALAADGEAWQALRCLQKVEIEDVLLRLLKGEFSGLSRSEREEAVGHAITALAEAWIARQPVSSIMGFLKVAARNKMRDLRKTRPRATVEFDPAVHSLQEPDVADDDPVARRREAVALTRKLLPELGLPSVVDTMTAFLDFVEAGADASPRAIADHLDIPYSTVTTHIQRGLERLERRVRSADLDVLLAGLSDDEDDMLEEAM